MTRPLLVRAARLEPVERTPVWFMRQAGRSLPEYRSIRAKLDLFAICRRPDVCAEVTLQPVGRHGVDAAVIYSDIMLPVLGMGVDVELVEGVGPVVGSPIRNAEDVVRLEPLDPESSVPYALESIRLVRRELSPEQALVGFVGGPFTVAGYLVEGRPSRSFVATKRCMYAAPDVWHALMDRLADAFAGYAVAQVDAGADVIQLFDSWVGNLSVQDYREFVAPYSSRILSAVDVPTIHFGTGCAHLLGDLAAAGGDCDRARLARTRSTEAGRRLALVAACRGTSIRRCCSVRSDAWRPRPSGFSTRWPVAPATSSISGTVSSRRPTPTPCGGSATSSTTARAATRSPERLAASPPGY